ncbi:MAG: DUF3846 domain-containing protein [Clostridia bacterium]|nr:DUF3846 domain-containing protein [Clostridia bacterium]
MNKVDGIKTEYLVGTRVRPEEVFWEKQTIKVLLVEPMREPKMVEIGVDLKSMQEVVGGNIEEIMPFHDEVAIVCNEDGKLKNLDLNRAIYDQNRVMIDVISGPFFVCSAPFESEIFKSLTDEQQNRYSFRFKNPEKFIETASGVKSISINTNKKEYER